MSALGDRPLRPPRPRGGSRAAKFARAKTLRAADDRALDRYAIVRFALPLVGQHSLRNIAALARQAILDGRLVLRSGLAPRKTALHKWLGIAERRRQTGTPLSVFDYIDRPRVGRTPLALHPVVEQALAEALRIRPDVSQPMLLADLQAFARDNTLPVPSDAQVQAARKRISPLEAAAAKHGRRAGVIDGGQKLTVPVQRPHDCWTLDEALTPVWSRALHPVTQEPVAVKRWALFTIDHFSRACITYHLFPAFRDDQGTAGFTAEEVVGAFLSAALTELAPEATRRFAGWLPQTVRMDNHASHGLLRAMLTGAGVEVPKLPVHMPFSRGIIERLIRTLKARCAKRFGHTGHWVPASRLEEHPKATRTVAAGTLTRKPRQTIVTVDELPSGDELFAMLGEVVQEYNTSVHRMTDGQTPAARYFETHDKWDTRSGLDALMWLPRRTLLVQPQGIDHGSRIFAAQDGHGRVLPVGTLADCRTEPLNRALFTQIDGVPTVLRPVSDVAAETLPGIFAAERADLARAASEAAEETRRVDHDRRSGPDASRRAEHEAVISIAERAERKARHHELRAKELKRKAVRIKQRAEAGGRSDPAVGRDGVATAAAGAPGGSRSRASFAPRAADAVRHPTTPAGPGSAPAAPVLAPSAPAASGESPTSATPLPKPRDLATYGRKRPSHRRSSADTTDASPGGGVDDLDGRADPGDGAAPPT